MNQLIGEYDCKMDTKGRVRIPTALIKQFGTDIENIELVINRGLNKNLVIFPKNVWEKKTNEINQRLNSFNIKHSTFSTLYLGGATPASLDASDRILISKRLIDYAQLEKQVVLLGKGESIELWDMKRYDELISMSADDYASLAEDVLGNLDIGGI